MAGSGKKSKVSSVIAALCIVAYSAALGYGIYQIIQNMEQRRNLAEREFYRLTETASSAAVFQGFMSDAYRETITDFLRYESRTLLGVIITSANGQYAFEQNPGGAVIWMGTTPRFKSGPAFPARTLHPLTLRIEDNAFVNVVTVEAVHSLVDNNHLLWVLRNILLAVLGTLALAFITFIIELNLKNRAHLRGAAAKDTASPGATAGVPGAVSLEEEAGILQAAFSSTAPQGLFSTRSNIGWQEHTAERLAAELHRCASFEQELSVLAMDFKGAETMNDALYRQFADEAVTFFAVRDLIFEAGENGITVIIPDMAMEEAMQKGEEFRRRAGIKLPKTFEARDSLYVGVSSRSGRVIEAERLLLEAATALEKTQEEPVSPIVAFKIDPEKYRQFIKARL